MKIKIIVFCLALALFFIPADLSAREGVAVSADGVPVAYSVYGEGRPVLFFVHGWSCNRTFWRNQVSYFEKKYRVVTIDLAGHGTSGQARKVYTMLSFGQDVAAVLKDLGSPEVILVGHSMAGLVMLEAAGIMPEQVIGLIGIDTLQDLSEELTSAQIEDELQPFREDFKSATASFVRGMFPENADPALVEQVASEMSTADPVVGISALEGMFKTSFADTPPKVRVAVWCLNSNLWPTRPAVNRKYLPGFNLRVMQDVGHFPMLEAPAEFNRQLDSIVGEIIRERK